MKRLSSPLLTFAPAAASLKVAFGPRLHVFDVKQLIAVAANVGAGHLCHAIHGNRQHLCAINGRPC